MKIYSTLVTIILVALFCRNAAATSTLAKVARSDGRDITQLFFSFNTTPKYTYKSGKTRVDILFDDTTLSDKLQLFATDDRIIKVLASASGDKAVVSLFFRYQPQEIQLRTASDGKVVFEVEPGNRDSRSYQELSERLKGLTQIKQEQPPPPNPLRTSPYAYDWKSFFRNYEAPVKITVPMTYTTPPFPVIALIPPALEKNSDLIPQEIQQLAAQQQWNDLLPQILDLLKSTADVEKQKLLALTYGETLLRNEDFTGAYKQLYLLQQKYPDEHIGIFAKYLLTLLEAKFQDPYLADADLQKLERIITPSYPLAPYFLLSRVETALATGQSDRARQLLNREDTPFPGELLKLVELRQGDYYTATDQRVKAFVTYHLLHDTPLLTAHPFSLNGYCDTLYLQKKYDMAAECYRELAPQLSDSTPLGLISFRACMAELHYKPGGQLIDGFARIVDAFPNSEARDRAAIKEIDLKYLQNNRWAKQAAKQYAGIAQNAVERSTAAEAYFKEALVYSRVGDKGRSIDLLLKFLRDFRVSALRDTAYALLIDDLPGEIKRLIRDGKYMEALVLAKKTRELFEKKWIDANVLSELAGAYQKLGIFSEAQRVYLYLLEVSDSQDREQFFLPLIQAVFDNGNYGLVEDFASEYMYNYPDGKHAEPVLVLRIRGLIASDRYDEAKNLLPDPLPENPDIHLLAARLLFRDEDYTHTSEVLQSLIAAGVELPVDARFMLAESRYQLADMPGAEALFSALSDTEEFGPQALYRLAQIERSRGNEEKALKYFQRIVEKGGGTPWEKLAEKELEYLRLNNSIKKMISG